MRLVTGTIPKKHRLKEWIVEWCNEIGTLGTFEIREDEIERVQGKEDVIQNTLVQIL